MMKYTTFGLRPGSSATSDDVEPATTRAINIRRSMRRTSAPRERLRPVWPSAASPANENAHGRQVSRRYGEQPQELPASGPGRRDGEKEGLRESEGAFPPTLRPSVPPSDRYRNQWSWLNAA